MSNNSDYIIRPYTPADNASLAVMWNESDDQWPGTFTGGVPMTEEQVQEWMERETCLMRLVAEAHTDDAIVGYGSLWQDSGREGVCYVALLNIHPAHQKRSLARRMLTQMVDWATEHNYHCVTIETWPGNLKSVPLYKKVGFFWVPDTDVYLENYIPCIRRLSVARRFFKQHNWYTTLQRELKQVEDDQRHPATGKMKVHIFRWEADGEFLEAVVDRQGQTLTGLETEHFAAHVIVDESEPAQGIAYPVRWQAVNKQAEPVNVSVLADGESGIELTHRASFLLEAGEERVLETTFTCAVDAPPLADDEHKPAPKIKTTLVIGGEVIELGTGLRYRPAVQVATEPEYPSLLPGQSKTLHLQLHNRATRSLQGAANIAPQPGLATDWQRREFEIEANTYAGLPLTVTCDQSESSAVPLRVGITFTDDDRQVVLPPQHIPLLVTPLGGVSADWDRAENKIVVDNDFFQLICRAKSGQCVWRNKVFQPPEARLQEEVGPPFTPSDLYDKQYDLTLEHGQGWAKIILIVRSGRFPGLTITREMLVTASPLVQVDYRFVNNADVPYQFQVKPKLRLSDRDAAYLSLPHQERLVIEHASDFPATHGDLPKKPEQLAEQWLALNREGQVAGAIWNQDVVEHESFWGNLHLHFSQRALEPQQAVSVGPFYVYVGPGDWCDIRRAWQRTVSAATQRPEILPEPGRAHQVDLSPSPVVTLNGQIEVQLHANNVRERALQGRLILEPPAGWQVDRAEFPLEKLALDTPLAETLRLTATNDRIGAAGGQLHLETDLFDEVRPFTVIRLGDAGTSVRVEESEMEELSVWIITNGRYTWTVAPAFHGGVIAWRDNSEVNHLLTAFPDDGELGWMKPWFGGLRPTLMLSEGKSWPGKLHRETFAAAPFEIAEANGLTWAGVQLTASLAREGFEGLRAEIAYLTVGGSNVLKVVYRLVNETSAYRRATPGLLTFWQVDGQHEHSILYGENLQRKRTPNMAWPLVGPWGATVNPTTGRTGVLVDASGQERARTMDWGVDGGHLFVDNEAVVAPHGSHKLVTYLALAESLEEAKQYACLAGGQ
jgi:RimJ/RimL family protein N-acetyltransferase